MNLLGACIGLGVLAFALGGVVLGWLAYMRIGRLERRLDQLDRERAEEARRFALATRPSAPPELAASLQVFD